MTGWHRLSQDAQAPSDRPVAPMGVLPVPVGAVETAFAVSLRTHAEQQAFVRMIAHLRDH